MRNTNRSEKTMGKYDTRNRKISPSRFQYPADKTVIEKILKLPVTVLIHGLYAGSES